MFVFAKFLLRVLQPGLVLLSACAQPPTETSAVGFVDRNLHTTPDTVGYALRSPADPNGIGKYYYGRQIAHVMGHEGADWLERAGRREEEGTDILLRELKLQPKDVVADIGAGTGYFTFRISPLVPQGKVYCVDIQPEMVSSLQQSAVRLKAANVLPVLGTGKTPNLPANSVDLVLIVDAYHEFDYPREMMQAIRKSLSPTGRVALVEYRAEDSDVPIKRIHKMSVMQARKELEAIGLRFQQSVETLPQQHLMFFSKGQ